METLAVLGALLILESGKAHRRGPEAKDEFWEQGCFEDSSDCYCPELGLRTLTLMGILPPCQLLPCEPPP